MLVLPLPLMCGRGRVSGALLAGAGSPVAVIQRMVNWIDVGLSRLAAVGGQLALGEYSRPAARMWRGMDD